MSGKRPTPKIYRVLDRLASGASLNRWQAAFELSDSCLHSTVAEIEGRFRLRVDRSPEVVRGYQGAPAHCKRYWLDTEQQRAQARKILEQEKERPDAATPGR